MHVVPFLTLLAPGAGTVQTIVWGSFSGIPQHALVLPLGSDTILETSGTATESTNDKGEYRSGLTSGATGLHKLNIRRNSDNKTLMRLQVVLGGAGQTSYAFDPAASSEDVAALVAAAVDERLSDNHGPGLWGTDDSKLILLATTVESVINTKTIVLAASTYLHEDNVNYRTVLLFDTSNADAVSGNASVAWDADLRRLTLAQTPPFALAPGDRVTILAVRDSLYAPTGRYVNR